MEVHMCAVAISPGVYSTEVDFSLYAPRLASTICAMVGSSSKGPTDERTLITDEGTLIETFGPPSTDHPSLYAAQQYLKSGRNLWFVRVANYDSTASGALKSGVNNAVSMQASSSGSWGDNLKVIVADSVGAGYQIRITYNNVVVEKKDGVLVGNANAGDQRYIETQFATSLYVVFNDSGTYTTLTPGTYSLAGGLDGSPASESDIIGTTVGNTSTGLQLFRNDEAVDINMILAPGRWERSIVNELADIAEARGDCMAIVDPPQGLTVQQVVDWHNGQLTGNPDYLTAAINSSYAALYWAWLQVYDSFNDQEVWTAPSGVAARIWAYSDGVSEPWFAPAGLVRGNPTNLLDLEHSPSQGERDYMYGYPGHNVNPFVNFVRDGITLWGQKTLQRAPTSLDRINVRRMLLYARKVIATAVRYLVFEPNDSITWLRFKQLVQPFLRNIATRRGISDFRVICDETTNTPYYIDQNVMRGNVLIKPTKAAEIIEIQYTLLPTGAVFEEFA
jgi:uncharacterized protein